MSTDRGWRSRWGLVGRAAITVLTLTLLGLLGEGVLRLQTPDGPYAWTLYKMGFEPTWLESVPYRHRPCGSGCLPEIGPMHLVGPDPDPTLSAGALRLVVLGDSMGVGYGLHHEQNWVSRLERELQGRLDGRPVEVANLCVGGYGLEEVRSSFLQWGRHLRPDIVVYGAYENDLVHLGAIARYHQPRVLVSFKPVREGLFPLSLLPTTTRIRLFRSSYLHQWLAPRVHTLLLAVGGEMAALDTNMSEQTSNRLLRGLLEDIEDVGAAPVVLLLPRSSWTDCLQTPETANCGTEPSLDLIGRIAQSSDVPRLDFRDRLRAAPAIDYSNRATEPADLDHYGPQGHAELGRFVADQLVAQGLIPPPATPSSPAEGP